LKKAMTIFMTSRELRRHDLLFLVLASEIKYIIGLYVVKPSTGPPNKLGFKSFNFNW
jgi:hypothetical protein